MNNLIKKAIDKDRIYPQLEIPLNPNPNKLYAIPVLGLSIKLIILFPIFIIALGLGIATFVLLLINPFFILFSGVYWKTAYEILFLEICYTVKIMSFIYGLTDKYPGFNFNVEGFVLKVPMLSNPSKLYAVPLIGLFMRVILMIPFILFSSIISNGARVGIFLTGWVSVLFHGRFPQSLHEIGQDSIRLQLASLMYFSGLEDKYPSFWISMKHKNIKILLIIIGILLTFNAYTGNSRSRSEVRTYQQGNPYQQGMPANMQNQNFKSVPNTYSQ